MAPLPFSVKLSINSETLVHDKILDSDFIDRINFVLG